MLGFHRPSHTSWPALAVTTILSIQLLVFMEWVFFVTKPSFLAVLETERRLVVLGLTPLPILVLATMLLVPLALASLALRRRPKAEQMVSRAGVLAPAAILGALFVLMADNFSNTMLGWSIESSAGFGRIVAVVVVLGSFVLGMLTALRWLKYFTSRLRLGGLFAGILLAASLITLAGAGGGQVSHLDINPGQLKNLADPLPNILLLGGDGLNADHLSAYGYERETTPDLEELSPYSLF